MARRITRTQERHETQTINRPRFRKSGKKEKRELTEVVRINVSDVFILKPFPLNRSIPTSGFLHKGLDTKEKQRKVLQENYGDVRYSGKDKCFYVNN